MEVATTVSGEQLQEAVELALEEIGALAVTLIDAGDAPVLEPQPNESPRFSTATVCGLFDESSHPDIIRKALTDRVTTLRAGDVQCTWQVEKDYVTAWQSTLEPLRYTDDLWVCPDGTAPPVSADTVILLTPGLAFGSGEHPTTALCMQWLAGQHLKGLTVVDYGCGSGILGVTAAARGAREVICVDHDEQAVTATQANAKLNGVQQQITACLPDQVPELKADVLVANIVLDPLLSLRDRFASLLRQNGQLVVTGLLADQAECLLEHYAPVFDHVALKSREDWRMISARRRSN